MTVKETRVFYLNQQTEGLPNVELGEPNSTFRLVTEELQPLKESEVLVKSLYFSNDPLQLGWIRKATYENAGIRRIFPGEPMGGFGLGQVIESRADHYQPGDIVNGALNWADYSIVKDGALTGKVSDSSLPLTTSLSTMGITGLTGYFGIHGQVKEGDTVVVSAASGATGLVAVQVAKALGCRVVGITGSDEKCKFVIGLGADACVNYHDPELIKKLKLALGEKGTCDVFYDSVGGELLDKVMTLMTKNGLILVVGAISGFKDVTKMYVKNWPQVIASRLTIKGFILSDYLHRLEEARVNLTKWIQQGKIRNDSSVLNVVDLTEESKFADIPKAWALVFDENKKPGKVLTKLADPE